MPFEDSFTQMLKDYTDTVYDKRKFVGLMRDLFPGQQMQVNLINTAFELEIASEIANAVHLNNAFAFRFVKRLVDEYGVSRLKADWAVSVWCVCYGAAVLRKPCDIKISKATSGSAPAIKEERAPEAGKQYGELFRYTKIPGGYGVTGFFGQNKRTLVISNIYNGQTVKNIQPRAFTGCEVQDAVMTDGIEIIEVGAFSGCAELKQAIFPKTLKEIGDNAFAGCISLTIIALPDRIEQIGRYAFSDTGLKTIGIPDSVYWLGEGMCAKCKSLNNVTIPDSILAIPDKLFQGCESLTDVKLPETLDGIGESAFDGCTALQSIVIPESVKNIGLNAFANTHLKFTLLCHRLSAVEQYARKNNISFQIIY